MLNKTVSNSKKGFTLIEIMVAIGIIVILTGIMLVAADSARKVARDNQRVTDIQLIQLKLEAYKAEKGVYPATLLQMTFAGYIKAIPVDPKGTPYYYYGLSLASTQGSGNCLSYHLGAVLETSSGSLQKAKHRSPGNVCSGSVPPDFNASVPYNGASSNLWYDVVSPNDFN